MKYKLFIGTCLLALLSSVSNAQKDSTAARKDTAMVAKIDSTAKAATDSVVVVPKADTAAMATPMNCYKEWFDYFTELGSKPVTDGTHMVVIAFKRKESCHCYMGKVEVAGGKIKIPVYVQTEGGEFKSFTAFGKQLDPEFISTQGDGLWQISNGMSVVFQTTEQEYGRIFFYKSLNKNKQMIKEAPSPAELLKN